MITAATLRCPTILYCVNYSEKEHGENQVMAVRHRMRRECVSCIVTGLAHSLPCDLSQCRLLGAGVVLNLCVAFSCSENLFKQIGDAMATGGFREAGYTIVAMDDCWLAPERDSQGHLAPDPDRFPGGIKALADYVRLLLFPFALQTININQWLTGGRGGAKWCWGLLLDRWFTTNVTLVVVTFYLVILVLTHSYIYLHAFYAHN